MTSLNPATKALINSVSKEMVAQLLGQLFPGMSPYSNVIVGGARRSGKTQMASIYRGLHNIVDELHKPNFDLLALEVHDDVDYPSARVAVYDESRSKRDPRNPNPNVTQKVFRVVGGGKIDEFGSLKQAKRHAWALHQKLKGRIDSSRAEEHLELAAAEATIAAHPSYGLF